METKLSRMIRRKDLPAYVGLGRTQIAQMIDRGEFPRGIKLSDHGRACGWLESELVAWQAARAAKSRGKGLGAAWLEKKFNEG